jgi:hypothetical protein
MRKEGKRKEIVKKNRNNGEYSRAKKRNLPTTTTRRTFPDNTK